MVISGSAVTSNFLQFHASAMTLFLRSIWCICREFIDAVDYICQLSLSIHWWFQGLLLLCFRWWFMNLQWHSVFDNSMRQPWLYFCYRFDASVVSSRTLAIPYVRCHSFFSDDFNVYRDSVFADDLRTNSDIAFLTIPSINLDSIFAINLMRRQWIHWRCQFHRSAVTYHSMMISRSTKTLYSLTFYGLVVIRCFLQFHASTMTLFLLSI